MTTGWPCWDKKLPTVPSLLNNTNNNICQLFFSNIISFTLCRYRFADPVWLGSLFQLLNIKLLSDFEAKLLLFTISQSLWNVKTLSTNVHTLLWKSEERCSAIVHLMTQLVSTAPFAADLLLQLPVSNFRFLGNSTVQYLLWYITTRWLCLLVLL